VPARPSAKTREIAALTGVKLGNRTIGVHGRTSSVQKLPG
jgi:hypothetical protein